MKKEIYILGKGLRREFSTKSNDKMIEYFEMQHS